MIAEKVPPRKMPAGARMKRRWLQFRLRTLFALLTLAALMTGVIRHYSFVRERISIHEAKVAACKERLIVTTGTRYLSLQIVAAMQVDAESERIQSAIARGYLLNHASQVAQSAKFQAVKDAASARDEEVARLQSAQEYHQEQVNQYRRALWRPWLRVVKDHCRELAETPAKVTQEAALNPTHSTTGP
jgi:hypothetical protein